MQDQIRKHIEAKMAAATLEESPFPHLTIENFFPEDVYQKLLAYNPFRENAGEKWLSESQSQQVSSRTPYHARKQINFHNKQEFVAPEAQQAFWEDLSAVFLNDNWFPDLVRAKYPAYFSIRFGDLTQDVDFADHFRRQLFLQRHEPGYYIGPHTDIPTRVFTCIFSFPPTTGFEEFGTELLVPKHKLDRCSGHDHYTPDNFTVKKVAEYKPNNFLLFFKTRQGFHSVKAIDETVPDQRYGMQFQFYEAAGGVFNDLSDPDVMKTKHPGQAKEGLRKKIVRKLKLKAA